MATVHPRYEDTATIGWEDTAEIGWDQAIDLSVSTPLCLWLFDFDDGSYLWSTQAVTCDGESYEAKVDPESFDGVEIAGGYNGADRIQVVKDLTIEVWDPDGSYASADFAGLDVKIHAWVDDGSAAGVVRTFLMTVLSAIRVYDVLHLTLQDSFVYHELEKFYPNQPLVDDIWSSTGDSKLGYCMPVSFGTAYIPLPSVYVSGAKSLTASTISFNADTNTISDSGSGLGIFKNTNSIVTSGGSDNNGTYIPISVSASEIVLSSNDTITTEAAGDSVTITQGLRYYVLGEDTSTYTISQVRAPEGWPRTVWESADYTFSQETQDGYKVFQAIIHDADNDGTVDSNGLFRDGDRFAPIFAKYSRADTADLTNPAEILSDLVFSGSSITVDPGPYDLSVSFNGAFTERRRKYEWASEILLAANAALVIDETGHRQVRTLLNTPKAKIDTSEVFEDQFEYSPVLNKEPYDGGYIKFPKDGAPQALSYKYKVALDGSSSTNPTGDTLDLSFVWDSQEAQKLGILWLERSIDKKAEVSVEARLTQILRNPGDVVEVSGADYDADTSYHAVVRSVHITEDMEVGLDCERFGHDLSLYADISVSILTVEEDDTRKYWIRDPEFTGSYIVVSPDVYGGEYNNLPDAINSISGGRAAIFIKNGRYSHDNTITIPDVNLTIRGESRDGVILESPVNARLFERTDSVSNVYSFENFAIESQSTSTGYDMIRMEEGAWKLNLSNCKVDLWDDGSINSNGDTGIYVSGDGNGTVNIFDCYFDGGKRGAYTEGLGATTVTGSTFYAQTRASAEVDDLSSFLFTLNKVYEFVYFGVFDSSSGGLLAPGESFPSFPSSLISDNEIVAKNDSASGDDLCAIQISGIDSKIINNKITVGNTRNGSDNAKAIFTTISISEGQIANNTISMDTDITGYCSAIVVVGTNQASISTNTITCDASSASGVKGIDLGMNESAQHSSRNNVSNNVIDLVNNTADEVGIYLSGQSDDNYGDGNITINCGTNIDDTNGGTGNNIGFQAA
jgi:hypothetical protein